MCHACSVDIFDGSDYSFLLSRRVRKAVAVGVLLGVAFVPPVQRWYISQIQQHAQHITRTFISQLAPDTPPSMKPQSQAP